MKLFLMHIYIISYSNAANGIHSICRSNCTCGHAYKPICTKGNDAMYYSPCHAGCPKEGTVNSVSVSFLASIVVSMMQYCMHLFFV